MNNGIFTVGLILLILGIAAFGYYSIIGNTGNPSYDTRVGYYAFPFIGLGILVMIIGAIIPAYSTTTTSTHEAPTTTTHRRKTTTTVSEE